MLNSQLHNPNSIVSLPFKAGQSTVIVSDIHAPYEDWTALDIVVALLADIKPDYLVILGDGIDCALLSKFLPSPETPTLEVEIRAFRKILDIFEAVAPEATKIYTYGNHEDRYRKWMWSDVKHLLADDLFPSLEGAKLLNIEKSWSIYGYNQELDMGTLRLHHGDIVRKGAGASAKAEFERRLVSGISGHTHRQALYRRTAGNQDFVWAENGCLCKIALPYTREPDWQQGFTIVYQGLKQAYFEQVSLTGQATYFGGKKYTKKVATRR